MAKQHSEELALPEKTHLAFTSLELVITAEVATGSGHCRRA
eukprot:CAMPEP_0170188552 /NCGR_PEP_ID=MMETSP0040_2-20121228/44664_1 /TAXON_ID=641309 /ORGANISM="Lotharella oceanica, Strain CCMP622" /LENGTH=40 /DNA_ID= /DNA_START= /DNA_END= /DNA_ORIENTATION=